jgi:tRNA (mo5U34)-methyltransferase
MTATSAPSDSLAAQVSAHPLWYHTLELAPGLVTPGWFDLRPILDRMPWPDVRGKRCLDVGTWDGFLAFELERRGASEVLATDISDPSQWDWAVRDSVTGPVAVAAGAGDKNGVGFELAKRALGSSVERREINAYDLDPELIGTFDVVVCGSLMLHLRDPIRALEAIRSVCDGNGVFVSAEQVRPDLSALLRRRPVAQFQRGEDCQWWVPNVAGHREMVSAAGFEIERSSGLYAIPLGKGHPDRDTRPDLDQRVSRLLARGPGVAHAALLAKRAI